MHLIHQTRVITLGRTQAKLNLNQYCLDSIVNDSRPLPPPLSSPEEDEALFAGEPYIVPPIRMDYGTNVRIGLGTFLNFNTVFIDTCLITVGARTLFGPNCSLYSGTHPLDPAVRNGLKGPETGKEIHIGEDCWLGGNVVVLPGVKIGRGCTVGAGSVVTKVSGTWRSKDGRLKHEVLGNRELMLGNTTQGHGAD